MVIGFSSTVLSWCMVWNTRSQAAFCPGSSAVALEPLFATCLLCRALAAAALQVSKYFRFTCSFLASGAHPAMCKSGIQHWVSRALLLPQQLMNLIVLALPLERWWLGTDTALKVTYPAARHEWSGPLQQVASLMPLLPRYSLVKAVHRYL